ncbi:hypothetical protein EJB05_43041 [Eragrostis curvula]|uniref:C2H2-type domain-containing protein n=1 Tax=Eragrostis curvula TaxID=38414 RepID=A0A5J9TEX4_9POAL|nr:hypothetical protein EJB05_43041 [Eragrostis curvula]
MMLSASFTEEVTPGDRLAIVGGEPKHDVDEGHGVQPLYGSGDQSGEQRETVESTVNNQSDELVVRPCQYGSASVKNRASHEQIIAFRECIAATCRTSGAMTLPEGVLVAAAASAGAPMMMSALVAEEVTPGDRWAAGREEHKHGVEDGLDVQPLHGSGNQCTEQMKTVESTMKYQSDKLLARPCQYRPASEENRASSKQKRIAFRECVPATCRTSGAMTLPEGALVAAAANAGAQMIMSALVAEEVTPGDRWAAGMEEHKHGVEDGHGMQPLHGSGNQCTEQTKIVESTMKYQSDQLLAQPCQYRPTSVENCASNEHKRIAFIEPVVKRKLKKRKLRLRWTCDLCQVSNPSPRSLVVHCNGRVHQSMLENARKEPLRPIGGLSVTGGGGGPSWPSGENAAWPADQASMWTCRLCNSICGSASILQGHLGGKKHRANTNAILALFRSSYTTLKNDGDGPGKSEYYCKACDVHCKGDMMMAAHLVERMHRLDWREV